MELFFVCLIEYLIKFMIMGDMKISDFDDFLVVFDILDMVDFKVVIEFGYDDQESYIKQNVYGDDDFYILFFFDVGVSVIVKNVRNIDFFEGTEKDGYNFIGNGLYNGFFIAFFFDSYSKDGSKFLKGDVFILEVILKDLIFSQFSFILSVEEFDDDEKIEVDDFFDKEDLRLSFRSNVLIGLVF